jgi:multidrug efflux pump subunit AcrB
VEALDVMLQDRTNGKLDKFSGIANNFIAKLMQKPAVAYAFTSYKADYPQLQLEIDDEKANQLGVNVKDILSNHAGLFWYRTGIRL